MISENNHNHKSSIKIQLSSNDDQSKTSSDFVSESDTVSYSSDYISKDQLHPDDIQLKDSKQRNYFLTKMALIMVIYWGASAGLQYHIIHNMNLYRKLYWIYKLNSLFWVYFLIFIVFKMTVSFIGDYLRNLQTQLFIFDLFMTYFVQIGLFFELNAYLETMYIWNGHYMVIFVYCQFVNSIAFLVSTMLQTNKDRYNFIVGFLLMELVSLITMYYFFTTYDVIVMGPTRYQIVYLVFTVVNFYITYDASLLLRYRKEKFLQSDNIFAFYTQWTNWFTYFWMDLFTRASDIRQKRYKKNYKGNLEAVDEDKDGVNDELVVVPINENGTELVVADSIAQDSIA